MRAGKPVHFLFDGCEESGEVYNPRAKLLLEAFQIYEDSLCSGCSQSSFHSLDVANTRAFETDEAICLGCNVRASHEAQYADEKKRPRGLKVFVVNRMGTPGMVED